MNFSQVSYFTLTAYIDIGLFKYLVFVFFPCLYVFIICCNAVLIVVICITRSLHEPMYMFLCSLFVNELYGSTGLFPFLLIQILSDVHTVSAPLCFLQIFCIYMYGNTEFYNLAVMSYDRYVAICQPLRYSSVMSDNFILRLVVFSWFLPLFNVVVMLSLSTSSPLCGNVIDGLYCTNYNVAKLASMSSIVSNVYGLLYIFTVIVSLAAMILYTYMRILKVCFSGSKQTRQKAVSTCTPHLASLINFSFGSFFEMMQSRFNTSHVTNFLRIILSLYFIVGQPLLNPVLYWLQLKKLRLTCRTLFSGSK